MSDRFPLLLLPGWNGRPRELRHMASYLVQEGWPRDQVSILGFRDVWGSNVAHAEEIHDAIRNLRDRTGAPRVDIIAFSMSGLAVRWHLAHAPEPGVRRVIFVGTPHRGTFLAHIGWGQGAREMRPGSEFLRSLQNRPLPPDVHAYTVRTLIETRVFPGSHARYEPAVADYCVRYATHPGMLRSREVFGLVRTCLSEEIKG
jgi:pimeloyl-ACP methyl ester carboxylesterase